MDILKFGKPGRYIFGMVDSFTKNSNVCDGQSKEEKFAHCPVTQRQKVKDEPKKKTFPVPNFSLVGSFDAFPYRKIVTQGVKFFWRHIGPKTNDYLDHT